VGNRGGSLIATAEPGNKDLIGQCWPTLASLLLFLRFFLTGSREHLLPEGLERPEADRSADTSARIGGNLP